MAGVLVTVSDFTRVPADGHTAALCRTIGAEELKESSFECEVPMLKRADATYQFRYRICSIALALITMSCGVPAFAAAVDIPFELCDGMICLPVTLSDGNSHRMLLDTGNVNSWLTMRTAEAQRLKLEPIQQDGKVLPGLFRLGSLSVSLGKRTLTARFLALTSEQTGELPPGVEGALAYTIFKDLILQIDYPHQLVRILDAETNHVATDAAALALITFGAHGPPVVVGSGFSVDRKTVRAQIDTCYTGTFLVYDKAIEDLGLQSVAARGRPKYFPYTDGGVNMNQAAVRSLSFRSYVLAKQPATVYFSGSGKSPVHQPDGLFEATVGNALFLRSVLTLDFHQMKISVKPG